MRIVLASESPFRRRAMEMLGLAYEVFPAHLDEKAIRDSDPIALTLKLAEAKAREVAKHFSDAVIVAGDAVVAKGDRIYEKPLDLREAAQFLGELSGSEFRFVTSVAVLHSPSRRMLSAVEASQIFFRSLLDREIRDYIGRYEVLKYAGAFESDAVSLFAARVSGSYNFVTAMPVGRLMMFLREHGIEI